MPALPDAHFRNRNGQGGGAGPCADTPGARQFCSRRGLIPARPGRGWCGQAVAGCCADSGVAELLPGAPALGAGALAGPAPDALARLWLSLLWPVRRWTAPPALWHGGRPLFAAFFPAASASFPAVYPLWPAAAVQPVLAMPSRVGRRRPLLAPSGRNKPGRGFANRRLGFGSSGGRKGWPVSS